MSRKMAKKTAGRATPAAEHSDQGMVALFSTCWRRSAAPAKTRSPPTAATSPISPTTSPADEPWSHGDDRRSARLSRRSDQDAACSRRRWRAVFPRSASSIVFSMPKGSARTTRPRCWKAPSAARALPKTLTLAEVDRLLRVAGQSDPAAPPAVRLRAARLACLVELLYATGLRVSELVALAGLGGAPRCAGHRRARQRQQRTHGAAQRRGQAGDGRLSGAASQKPAAARPASKWLFPSFGDSGHLTRQHFARELKALAGCGRSTRGAAKPARAAPRLRQPSFAQRRRSARGADAAGPRRHLDHADLHTCARGTAQEPCPRFASVGGHDENLLLTRYVLSSMERGECLSDE